MVTDCCPAKSSQWSSGSQGKFGMANIIATMHANICRGRRLGWRWCMEKVWILTVRKLIKVDCWTKAPCLWSFDLTQSSHCHLLVLPNHSTWNTWRRSLAKCLCPFDGIFVDAFFETTCLTHGWWHHANEKLSWPEPNTLADQMNGLWPFVTQIIPSKTTQAGAL